MSNQVDILAFAAHPDDVELAASGTIMKHIDLGYRVVVVDLTEGSLGSRGSVETRYKEAKEASKIIGIDDRVNLKMRDGFFEITESNKIKVIEQIRRFRPKIVLANALNDRHPDHGRAAKLVSEACFYSGLVKVETKWEGSLQEAHRPNAVYHYIQDYYQKPDFVVDVSEYSARKEKAILAYSSQFYDPNSKEPETPISGKDFLKFVEARMIDMGRQIGANYGEGFNVNRYLGVNDLFDLK